MRTIISAVNAVSRKGGGLSLPALAFGLFWVGAVQAQVGASISADGTPPNVNAMLDVQSPAGGLLDNSGNLRGGAAQGLIVYQTDGVQGLYFNTSLTAAPAWVY